MMVVLILSGSVGIAHSASAQNQSGDQGTGCCVATDSLVQWLSPLYRGWLTEDVAYIISKDERCEFLQLTNDADRDFFIKEFWQRRNPDPDSQDNPFEEEHYRRMAYSNEHFSTNGFGWQTDSGRIYITWGEPDQIQPGVVRDAALAPASETWKYRYVEGIGENVEVDFIDHRLIGDEPVTRNFGFFTSGVDGSELSALDCAYREWLDEGVLYSIGPDSVPTSSQFRELEAVADSHAILHGVNFDLHLDYVPVTHFTTLVPAKIEIAESELEDHATESGQPAQLNLVYQITDARGRVVEVFEKPIPPKTVSGGPSDNSVAVILQKSFPLRPGAYEIAIIIGDANSGQIGSMSAELRVPSMPTQK
jgi:GWxTD domain-containing protein